MSNEASLPLRLIDDAECERLTGLSRTERWRREKAGTFPKRVKLGGRVRVGWVESEIFDWIRDRIAERDRVKAA